MNMGTPIYGGNPVDGYFYIYIYIYISIPIYVYKCIPTSGMHAQALTHRMQLLCAVMWCGVVWCGVMW